MEISEHRTNHFVGLRMGWYESCAVLQIQKQKSALEWCLSVPLTSSLQLLNQTQHSLQLWYTCKEQLHNPRIIKLLTNARWVPIHTAKQLLYIQYITLLYTKAIIQSISVEKPSFEESQTSWIQWGCIEVSRTFHKQMQNYVSFHFSTEWKISVVWSVNGCLAKLRWFESVNFCKF